MREVDIERTAYPQLLLNIKDREIIERYTLEPEELSLVKNYRGDELSLAVRLKVFGHLLSHNLPLSEVPQKVIDYIASQIQEETRTLSESRSQRYEQINTTLLISSSCGTIKGISVKRPKAGGSYESHCCK